jgi:hypothetical protein
MARDRGTRLRADSRFCPCCFEEMVTAITPSLIKLLPKA